jgi:hypothetical protein
MVLLNNHESKSKDGRSNEEAGAEARKRERDARLGEHGRRITKQTHHGHYLKHEQNVRAQRKQHSLGGKDYEGTADATGLLGDRPQTQLHDNRRNDNRRNSRS